MLSLQMKHDGFKKKHYVEMNMVIFLDIFFTIVALFMWSIMLYNPYFKRFWDIVLSAIAIVALFPLMLVLTILGTIKMKGNPFFTQERPGKDEKIFKLIKFRSMTCAKDKDGNLLPDEVRLTGYGKKLRSTSLDELPELFNILKGDMSIVGPRPLLVQYLPRYNKHQARRHEVRPGFTGLAQVHGRNAITWEEKFEWDVKYVDSISFKGDLIIVLETVKTVFKREGINGVGETTMTEFMGSGDRT